MDENAKSKKNRGWIKNIAIIFLLVMLALTLFSNTILNYSLPEVAAQYPRSGTITTKIKGSGTITANQSYDITIDETRTIKEVLVKKGQNVSSGDVLFILEDSESEELKAARKDLLNLQNALYLAKLKNDNTDAETQRALEAQKQALEKLKTELASLGQSESALKDAEYWIKTYTALKDTLADTKTDLDTKRASLKATVEGYLKDYELDDITADAIASLLSKAQSAQSSASFKYTYALQATAQAQAAYERAKAEAASALLAYESASKAEETFKTNSSSSGGVTKESLLAAQRAIEDKTIALTREQNELSALRLALNTAITESEKARNDIPADTTDPTYADKLADYNAKLAAQSSAQSAYDSKNIAVEDATRSLSRDQQDYARDQQIYAQAGSYNQQLEYYKQSTENAKAASDSATKNSDALKTALDERTDNEKTLKAAAEDADAKLKVLTKASDKYTALTQCETELEDVKAKIKANDKKLEDMNDLKASITAPRKAEVIKDEIDKAQTSYDESLANYEYSSESTAIDLKNQETAIDEKQAEVTALTAKAVNAEVKTKIGGVVASLSYVAGEKADKGATLAQIQVVDKGYTVTFTVTNEQAARIKIGDAATPLYYYWGEVPAMKVASIKNDTSNPGKSKVVTLDVTGSVNAGESISFTLGEKGANYDIIVPNSAIREDSNGKFILVVVAKSTPLGNRYTASRVDVSVAASDETQSAVTGALYGSEYVITTSTKPIASGTQVRLIES